ncbi:OCRE domain [Popillia japonica]|uniref:OCRE domain n=1 Tax=Popillia japonica TaxID=7064 RepID=A0AAW1L730_POPJA
MANCGDSKSAVVNTDDYYSSDSNSSTHFDNLLSVIEQKLCDLPDVWEYVISLRKFVLKQQKKIKKLQRKLKGLKRKETNEVAVQTNTIEDRISKTITEEIKEAAENAMQNQGMVYEETSGLYYDYNSGYYYNAEYGLYYDGNTGTYMSYDTESQQYVFHSQVETKTPEDKLDHDENKDQGKSQERKRRRSNSVEGADLEEGECSDESAHVSESESGNSDDEKSLDYSSHWPPCIRIIVEETSIPTLKTGSLYVITYEGGTLGREGKHDILLTDINVSKHHLKFSFNKDSSSYFVIDLGSRNGTLLNGKRMSSSKQESEQFEVVHGARIQIGSTVLLCHIHKGSQTCGLCEPGLLQSKEITENRFSIKVDKNADHKQQLKKLRKKFAVNHSVDSGLAPGYTDRAQARRETIGSQNEHEKTQVASLEQCITSENKGFKLLAKMGWKEGQSLGKEGTGALEPVKLVSNIGTSGMGSKETAVQTFKTNKTEVWTKTRERYDQLSQDKT